MSVNTAKSMPCIEARISRLNSDTDSNVKAFATIIIDNAFVITGVKIKDFGKGLFVGMPCKKYTNGEQVKYYDVCHPITREAHDDMTKAVLDAYSIYLEEQALLSEDT